MEVTALFKITGLNSSTEYYYGSDGNWYSNQELTGNAVTLSGVTVADGTVTINKAALDSSIQSNLSNISITLTDLNDTDSNKYRLALGSGFDDADKFVAPTFTRYGNQWEIIDSSNAKIGVYVSGDGLKIGYESSLDAYEDFEITGLKSSVDASDITVCGDRSIVISANALDSQTVELSSSVVYHLVLGADVQKSATTVEGWSSAGGGSFSYMTASSTSGYLLDGNDKITYQAENTDPKSLFTIKGLSAETTIGTDGSIADITVNKSSGYVNLLSSALLGTPTPNNPTTLTLTDDDDSDGKNYVLGIKNFTTETNSGESTIEEEYAKRYNLSVGGYSTFTYSLSAYIYKEGNTLTSYAADTDTFTINGLASTNGVSSHIVKTSEIVNGVEKMIYTITLYNEDLNKKNISIDLGSTQNAEVRFVASENITQSKTTAVALNASGGGSFTFTPASGTAGYLFSTSSVEYSGNDYGGETFTITGLSVGLSNFEFTTSADGKTTTITANAGTVTVATIESKLDESGTGKSTYNITLNDAAIDPQDGESIKLNAEHGNFNLTVGTHSTTLETVAPALQYTTAYGYSYMGGYSKAYFESITPTNSSDKVIYKYHATTEPSAPHFGLSGLSLGITADGSTSGATIDNYFTLSSATEGDKTVYSITLGESAMTRTVGTMTLQDLDSDANITYKLVDPDGNAELDSDYVAASGGELKFQLQGTSAGYILGSDSQSLTYQADKGVLFTISGLSTSLGELSLDGTSIKAGDVVIGSVSNTTEKITKSS